MSVVDYGTTASKISPELPLGGTQLLHRLRAVRCQQGLSQRQAAKRMNITIDQVRQQECESSDLPLSVLYAWQKALNVPVAELLVEVIDALASPILERSQLVRLTKTVLAVREKSRQDLIRRMAQTMHDQLVEIMPELANVVPWPGTGKPRRLSELGVAAQRRVTEEVFFDRGEWSVWDGDECPGGCVST